MVSNEEIARVLYEIADYLEATQPSRRAVDFDGERSRTAGAAFRPRAYRAAAKFIEHYPKELTGMYQRGGVAALKALPEIGESLAKKIGELLDTGKLVYLTKLRQRLPVDMVGLNHVEGVGPKTIALLYQKLQVRTVKDLATAAQQGLIRNVPGFSQGSEQRILRALGEIQGSPRAPGRRQGYGRPAWLKRQPRQAVEPVARRMVQALKKLPEVERIEVAGSLRRQTTTVGDVDLVVASLKPQPVMEAFANLPEVKRVYSRGDTKMLVRLNVGLDADLRVVPPESFGAALQYFTGPKEHSIATRHYARDHGLKLNEYGLFKGKKMLAGKTEKEVYQVLGLQYEAPAERSTKLVEEKG